MALDDRERHFEKALARQLRSATGSENSAHSQGNPAGIAATCPDAEILAAYHERGLTQEELISCKTHIAGCARCQELLAQLELTDPIPLHAEAMQVQQPLALNHENSSPQLRTTGADAALPAPSAKIHSISTSRPSRLRWIAPAGAIAAGLLVWIAVRDNKSLPVPVPQPVEVARKMEATAMPSATPKSVPVEKEKARQDLVIPRLIVPAKPSDEKDAFAKTLPLPKPSLQGRKQRELQNSAQNGALVGGAVQVNQNTAAFDSSPGAGTTFKPASNQAAGAQQNAEVQAYRSPGAAGTPPPGIPPPPPAQSQASPAAAAPSQTADALSVTAQNQLVATPEARDFSSALELKKVRASRMRDARLATAPSGDVRWRVGLAGLIEKSADGGKTFVRQESGVKTELVAASAPDDLVCWVVGRSGAILVTVDGGAHWGKVTSPMQTNIGGVFAKDAMHASIWNVADQASFTTSDGGATWTRASGE